MNSVHQATHAHAFKARAADRKAGFAYIVVLTNGPGMTIAEQVGSEIKARNMREVKAYAKACGLIAHNF